VTKPATHIVTTAACETCHKSTVTFTGATFNHTGVTGNCSSCHNGVSAPGPTAVHSGISPGQYECNACHRTTAWLPPTFTHTGVTSNCANCHKAGFATTKSASHFVTTQPCEKCHTTTAWSPIKAYVHTSIAYKAHSGSPTCAMCHIGNNEVISGAPYRGNAAYKPNCAWCHASQFKPDSHKKTEVPSTVYYTVAELKDCSGSCHLYTNNTFTAILSNRTSKHHSTDSGF
jgi:hypothetical protein